MFLLYLRTITWFRKATTRVFIKQKSTEIYPVPGTVPDLRDPAVPTGTASKG